MTVINCTPHAIVLENSTETIRIPRSGTVLRIEQRRIMTGEYDVQLQPMGRSLRVPLTKLHTSLVNLDKLAEQILDLSQGGRRIVIVSGLLLDALKTPRHLSALNRCAAPDTSPDSAIRDEKGQIAAVRGLRVRRPNQYGVEGVERYTS